MISAVARCKPKSTQRRNNNTNAGRGGSARKSVDSQHSSPRCSPAQLRRPLYLKVFRERGKEKLTNSKAEPHLLLSSPELLYKCVNAVSGPPASAQVQEVGQSPQTPSAPRTFNVPSMLRKSKSRGGCLAMALRALQVKRRAPSLLRATTRGVNVTPRPCELFK